MNFFDVTITDEAKRLVAECLDKGMVSEGEYVDRFGRELQTMFGLPNITLTNSCTSALHLALVLAGVREGDEVILPAQTFVATGLVILYQKAVPVFADIQYETGNIDPDDIRKHVTAKTKAVIAVAWGGMSPDLVKLNEVCDQYGLVLILDNAHALGHYSNLADFPCYSFQAIKQLTTGDGGALVCAYPEDYEVADRLKWFGISRNRDLPDPFTGERSYNLRTVGYKYQMNNIAAALGLGNLNGFRIRENIRKEIANYYGEHLHLSTTYRKGSTNWLYNVFSDHRSQFITKLMSMGIPASVVHVGIHKNDVFGREPSLLETQRKWDKEHFCIPCHSGMTMDDAQRVVDAINGGW